MKSGGSGHQGGTSPYGYGQGSGGGMGSGYSNFGQYNMSPVQMTAYQPVSVPAGMNLGGGINFSPNMDVKWAEGGSEIFQGLQSNAFWGMGGATLIQLGNAFAQAWAIHRQADVMEKYYQTEFDIANIQGKVANKALAVKDNAVMAWKEMHKEQLSSDYEIARLTKDLQVQLESIRQDGQTRRAELYVAKAPFYGDPMVGIR